MNSKKKYIQNLKNQFHAIGKNERIYLNGLIDRINSFESLNAESTYEDYLEEFGLPEEIISEYYENYDKTNLIRKIKWTKYTKMIFYVSVIALLIFVFFLAKTQLEIQKSYPHHDEIIIITD